MAAATQERPDRLVNARFMRNLALSLSGGAILTIAGAAVASAQDAGTDSAGAAGTGTGDATAVGNRSGTSTNQSLAPSDGNSSPQVMTQTATVPNVGVAIANTGGNVAVGNSSTNTVVASQLASGGGVATTNGATVGNGSNGSAWITTGDATAVGNESTTSIDQTALGQVSGLLVVTQDATVANVGIAVSNTGLNTATGNDSTNAATLTQAAGILPLNGLAANAATVATASNGRASVTTGDGNATGNRSRTGVAQRAGGAGDAASGGLVIIDQDATVANVGIGIANTGLNTATGNATPVNTVTGTQSANNNGFDPTDVPLTVASNNADLLAGSDGDASIDTGDAWAVGNDANTNVVQAATGDPSAMGNVVTTQTALIGNIGIGVANSGLNTAVGNASPTNSVVFSQGAVNLGAAGFESDVVTASNAVTATSAIDGTAEVVTGDAGATGNKSDTTLDQQATGDIAGAGNAITVQDAGVINLGVGIANSGLNVAAGNASTSAIPPAVQNALTAVGPTASAPAVTTSNTADLSATSDGTGTVHTGDANATGNESATEVVQAASADVDGAGTAVSTQDAVVANVGIALANSGVNAAVGNASLSFLQGAGPIQNNGVNVPAAEVDGPITNSNALRASNASDGTGSVHTGDAVAQGNRSGTALHQTATAGVGEDGMGVIPNDQEGTVVNVGVGVANSGVNAAVGNASGLLGPNNIIVGQNSQIGLGGGLTDVNGPITSSNTLDASNASDGTGKVHTGDAGATGNVSHTELTQNFDGSVDGGGVVVGPQSATVANVGIGIANSGINASIGNASSNSVNVPPVNALAAPGAGVTEIDGPLTVGNNHTVANASDGEACSCTGDASATGNIARSTLTQDLEIGVEDGVSVVPMTGTILNVGFGIANSGVNLAVGNLSQNTTTVVQTATLDPAATGVLDGPQTIVNGGSATNSSNGLGEVGTGKASATGNFSESDLNQAAVVDGAGAVGVIGSGITNVGVGLANSGVNLGIGNASVNSAFLTQTATGTGTVTNSGDAGNTSDGTGQIGDPNCEDKDETTPDEEGEGPTGPSLPRTGSEVETQAALGLLLLLAGFGLTGATRRRRSAA